MYSQERFLKNRDEVRRAEFTASKLFQMAGIPVTLNPTPKLSENLSQLRQADLLYAIFIPYAEVKVDWMSATTKNVAFEIDSLRASEAHWLVQVLPVYFVAPRKQILT